MPRTLKIPTDHLGSGTASATTFLRGDQSWQTTTGFTPIGGIIFHNIAAASLGTYFDATGLGKTNQAWNGFAICNGNNGTPNLASTFVRMQTTGAGATGGSDSSAHTHTGGTLGAEIDMGSTEMWLKFITSAPTWTNNYKATLGCVADTSHTYAYKVQVDGVSSGASATDNRPAYYELVPVMRVA